MVVEIYVSFKKILECTFFKTKWPTKSKIATIIHSFMRNYCNGYVYHKTIMKIGIIHIYIKILTCIIQIQIKIQYGRQNLRWPPQSDVLIRKMPEN